MPEAREILEGIGFRGGDIRYYDEVNSTMDVVRETSPGWNTTVVATTQTLGRGRFDRRWSSPTNGGLYLTTWIEHNRTPAGAANLSQGTALALALLCRELGIAQVRLKWPNDLLIAGRKCAGILAECYAGKHGTGIAVGVGINVDTPREVLAAVGQPATSLSQEAGHPLIAREVLLRFLALWGEVDALLEAGGFAAIAPAYRSFSDLPGRVFGLSTGSAIERVRVLGIEDDGSLLVEPEAGGPPQAVWGGELVKVEA